MSIKEKIKKAIKPKKAAPKAKVGVPEQNLKQQNDAQAATAVAPRVNLHDMERKIVNQTFYHHAHLTICVLEMANGFYVIGSSAPASPANFDEQIGYELAYEDCIRQLWRLEGYALRERLAAEAAAEAE